MSSPERPFPAHNFEVTITIYDGMWVCTAGFQEVSGLQMSMKLQTIREGGNNGQQIHLPGPIEYGQLTLKRGLTLTGELWSWFEAFNDSVNQKKARLLADADLRLQGGTPDESVTFHLANCFPVRLVAPSLHAIDGRVAIEELAVQYERMNRVQS